MAIFAIFAIFAILAILSILSIFAIIAIFGNFGNFFHLDYFTNIPKLDEFCPSLQFCFQYISNFFPTFQFFMSILTDIINVNMRWNVFWIRALSFNFAAPENGWQKCCRGFSSAKSASHFSDARYFQAFVVELEIKCQFSAQFAILMQSLNFSGTNTLTLYSLSVIGSRWATAVTIPSFMPSSVWVSTVRSEIHRIV